MENKNRQGKTNKRNIRIGVVVLGALLLAFVCVFLGSTYAKYYAEKNRQGIAVASGFYFNSNKLLKIQGDITNIKDMDASNLMVNVNGEKWSGGDLEFTFNISNYDNNLLFNDENIDVGYTIAFCLLEKPQGAVYSICRNEATDEHFLTWDAQTGSNVVTFEDGSLKGGELSADTYTIRINLKDAKSYNNAKVLVMAYPTLPDYLNKQENQEHRLLGVFQGVYSETSMKVESAYFLVQEETDYSESTWEHKVEDLSGLIYSVKTVGDVVTDANNAVKQEVIIKWKSDYLEISEYDENYLAVRKKEAADNTSYIESKTENGVKWTYMTIDMLPYTSVNITFYKKDQFLEDIQNKTMQQSDFEGLVQAYTPDSEGSGD